MFVCVAIKNSTQRLTRFLRKAVSHFPPLDENLPEKKFDNFQLISINLCQLQEIHMQLLRLPH